MSIQRFCEFLYHCVYINFFEYVRIFPVVVLRYARISYDDKLNENLNNVNKTNTLEMFYSASLEIGPMARRNLRISNNRP